VADQQLKIGLYDTVFVVNSFTTFAPGTYLFRVNTVGNSILSTVYVHTGPGVATVRWFDFGAGREITDPGAQFTLHTHTTLGAAASERSIVTKIHNHVFCEVVVSGGSVEMGVLATLISQFPVDLIGLQTDNTPADLLLDGGLPVGVYDPADGNWYVLRGEKGYISVISKSDEGTPFHLRGQVNALPGGTVTVFTTTVPALTTKRLKKLWVTAYNDGYFSLEAGGIEIARGMISNVCQNISFNFDPMRPIGAGTLIELKYISDTEPNYPCPVTAFLSGNDVI
jgi:hypothetical protein